MSVQVSVIVGTEGEDCLHPTSMTVPIQNDVRIPRFMIVSPFRREPFCPADLSVGTLHDHILNTTGVQDGGGWQ